LILFRYLNKQILQVMLGVTLVLLVVALTSRFIQYLSQAVAGDIASDVLFLLMFYRLPDFLLVIVPLALLLGILIAFGRMYADNEMVVLLSSGMSPLRLMMLTQATSSLVLVLIAVVSLSLAPWGVRNTELLRQNQDQLTEIDLIAEGQFQSFAGGARVTYAEDIATKDGVRELRQVFVAVNTSQATNSTESIRLIFAESARPEIDPDSGARFMRLDNVMQYEGVAGRGDYSVGQFAVQSILLPDAAEFDEVLEEATLRTLELFGSNSVARQAELQWRLSIILLIPIITLIAVPFAKVNPRQGRYGKLLPAVLIYAAYFLLLQFARDAVADGDISPSLGLWWVHFLFLGLGIIGYRFPNITLLGLRA
jgi:lipopolysaccharide export system permease protein